MEIAAAVFELLSRHVSLGEISQARNALPEGVRRYWLADISPKGSGAHLR